MMVESEDSKPGSISSPAALFRCRFAVLLAALILFLLSAPLVQLLGGGSKLAPVLFSFALVLMLISAVFADSHSRRKVIISSSLAVPMIVLQVLNILLGWDGIAVVNHLLGLSFLSYTVIVILGFLFNSDRVTFNVICASLCVYLLLGVIWSIAYSLLEILAPGSFTFSLAEGDQSGMMRFGGAESVFTLYYSLVTLSTLGYGDIVPASGPARMLAVVEAIIGQLYLVVLVARLVGLHISQSAGGNRPNGG